MIEILLISALLLIIAILLFIAQKADYLYTKIWHIEYFVREADKRSKPQVRNIDMGKLKVNQLVSHIPKLEENKIYYLCHPCTTGGRTIFENKEREEALFKQIIKENPGIRIIRPLQIIPEDMPHEEAMIRCFSMLDAADALILPMGWEKSHGCSMEHKRAEKKRKERILLRTN